MRINVSHIISLSFVYDLFNEETRIAYSKGIVKGVSIISFGVYGYYTSKGYFIVDDKDNIFIHSDDKNAGWLLRKEKLERILKWK